MHAEEHFNAALDALEHEQWPLACQHLQSYLEREPQDADAWHNLGVAHYYQQQHEQATQAWATALQYSGDRSDLDATLQEAALEQFKAAHFAAAEGLYRLLASSPQMRDSDRFFYAHLLNSLGKHQQCEQFLLETLRREPRHLGHWFLLCFLLPYVYDSPEAIVRSREKILQRLDKIESLIAENQVQGRWTGLENILTGTPIFPLMPQGYNERETFARISRIWEQLFVQALPPLQRHESPKVRLGMVCVSVWNHSTMHYFQGMIEHLHEHPDFETALFYFGSKEDHMTRFIQARVDHFEQHLRELEPGIQAVRSWQPDILLYLDIGQESLSYTLAHHRLAPVQCVTAGVPVTTGIQNMDYYISSRYFEVPEAQEHYSEKLILLDNNMVCMRRPMLNAERQPRSFFGLPEDAHLYLFPHTLFRVDPELDAIFAEILERDPLAEIVFIRTEKTLWHEQLSARFERNYGSLVQRLRFLPWMAQGDFFNVVELADVSLDALRLGGGNISFQVFYLGTPTITRPGEFLRNRIASGLYRILGLEQWIASDLRDYVEKALQLGTQPELNAELRAQLIAGRDLIFDRREGLDEIFTLFKQWAQKSA